VPGLITAKLGMEKRRALFSDAADVVKAVLIKGSHQEVVAVPLSFLQ
jgi:hypothetical protein